ENQGFLSKIIDISNFLDGVVSKHDWLKKAETLVEIARPLDSEPGLKQKEIVCQKLKDSLQQIKLAKNLYIERQANGEWITQCEQNFIRPIEEFAKLADSGKWDELTQGIRVFNKPSVHKPKGLDEEYAKLIQNTVKEGIGSIDKVLELAILNPDYTNRLAGSVSVQTKVVIELIRKFDELYIQSKNALNCMDFADLEHYALKLLADEKNKASETAMAFQRKYRYIFVDEYQDINHVQKNILNLLSSGDNLFAVGDIKQSIYGFRGTNPDIFAKQLESISTETKTSRLRVDLNVNFRSDKRILDFVNTLFEQIMTKEFTGIDYDELAKLNAQDAKSEIKSNNPAVELHILDKESKDADLQEEEQVSISAQQHQAALIAKRIRRMVGAGEGKSEFLIFDKDLERLRGVEYRDIAILMRSPAKRVNNYVEILRLAGVPVSCKEVTGYFEATEITDVICLLKILDNPMRDIELAAVLRSPLFGISDSELAKTRIYGKSKNINGGFYNCLTEYAKGNGDWGLCEKIKNALNQINKWRTQVRRRSLADIIWQIYRETGFLSFVSALPSGQQRKANLLKLHDRAIQFEGFVSNRGLASLGRFVEFIEKIQNAGYDWGNAEPEAEIENAVRIISVHKSKGLEFPVVFLAEANSLFNTRDYSEDFLCDAEHTLGLQVIEKDSNSKLPSLAHQVIAEERRARNLAEEMRILYVAMTRARERLILTGCEKKEKCEGIVRKGYYPAEKKIPKWQLENCKSHLEWVLCGLGNQKNLNDSLGTGIKENLRDDDLFGCKIYDQKDLDGLSKYINQLRANKQKILKPKKTKSPKTQSRLIEQIKSSLKWRYENSEAVELPAKWSVTELTHQNDEYARVDYSKAMERKPKVLLQTDTIGTIEGRLIGTATHSVIAKLDLERAINKETIEKTIEELLRQEAITEAVAECINTESISGFFESELGQEALNPENKVYREWPFSFGLGSEQIKLTKHDKKPEIKEQQEIAVVQGIIDMLIQTKEGVIVIDFKTDKITQTQAKEKASVYKQQLNFYSEAANKILKDKIKGKWLYFLGPECAIEV
ncbi:MAG: helicase-exonuclease AddAB subunit AddA, partial [Planctomycetota bacterium]